MIELERILFIVDVLKKAQSEELSADKVEQYKLALEYMAEKEKMLTVTEEVDKTIRKVISNETEATATEEVDKTIRETIEAEKEGATEEVDKPIET